MNYVYPRSASGIFELRYPIPKNAQRYFPKQGRNGFRTHIIESLSTKDQREANEAARQRIGEIEALFRTLTLGEVDDSFREFLRGTFKQELERDLNERLSAGFGQSDASLDQDRANLRLGQHRAYLRAVTSNDFEERSAVSSWLVEIYLQKQAANGLSVSRDTPAWIRMVEECAKVMTDVTRAKIAREVGLTEKPKPDSHILTDEPPEPGGNVALSKDGRLSLSSYFAIYEKRRQRAETPLKPRTLKRQRVAWEEFCDVVGGTTPIWRVKKADVWKYHEMLLDFPQRAGSMTALKEMTFKQRVVHARANPDKFSKLDLNTVGDKLRHVNVVFNHAVDRGDIDRNPGEGVRARKTIIKVVRKAYSADELTSIFSMSPWYSTVPAAHERTDEFWVPLVELFSGARPSEVYLPMSDVYEGAAIPHLHLIPFAERSLKTPKSARKVPIHSELIKLGFLELCSRMRASGASLLFPEWDYQKDVNPSESSARRRFNRAIKRTLKDRGGARMDAYTFRHTFETFMSTATGIPERVALRLTGRTVSGSANYYVDELPLESLRDAIERVRFDGLDLTRFHLSDPD